MIIVYPYQPVISERANCGPTVLATVLNVSTEEAISLIEKHHNCVWPEFTNVGHIRSALEGEGLKMIKTKEHDEEWIIVPPEEPVLFFLQLEGPWMGKGWRAEYNNTHWVLVDKQMFMDVNNPRNKDKIRWVDDKTWKLEIIPWLCEQFKSDGWHVRSAYRIEEE